MRSLEGRRIALLESRSSEELATLVRRLGGSPIAAPAVESVPCHDDFGTFIDGLSKRRYSIAIFLTGLGITTLMREAERRRRLGDAVDALRQMTIACRGAKPLTALKRYGLKAQITTGKPHTTEALVRALATTQVADRGVVLVHYGERNHEIADALRSRGARLDEVCPYAWALPADTTPLAGLVGDALARRVDAVLFTSQIQCKHLFDVAEDMGVSRSLALSLNGDIVVGAVGPVCAARLRELGVTPDVIPAAPNMASLISAIGDYFELTGASHPGD